MTIEPLESYICSSGALVVGPLPVFEFKRPLGEVNKRILDLGLRRDGRFIVIVILLLRLLHLRRSRGISLLLLLSRESELDSLLSVRDNSKDGLQLRLTGDSDPKVSDDSGVFLHSSAPRRIGQRGRR